MQILMTKTFVRWMRKSCLTEEMLLDAVQEFGRGLVDADLGANVFKKRVRLPGRGKRGSARTIVATCFEGRFFFLYGFEKNERENISAPELTALKQTAAVLLALNATELHVLLDAGKIFEVPYAKEQNS